MTEYSVVEAYQSRAGGVDVRTYLFSSKKAADKSAKTMREEGRKVIVRRISNRVRIPKRFRS
jgi:hypothetical protein